MEHFKKLERMYLSAPTNDYWKPRLEIGEGIATLELDVRPDFHHAAGAMHGTTYFKAIDDAAYFAVSSLVKDVFVLTATMEIEFLRPVVEGTIRAVGRVERQDERRFWASAELFHDSGVLVGRGKGSFARSKNALRPEVGYR